MLNFAAIGFDWDSGNRAKCQKHGVTVEDIEAVFAGEVRVAPDVRHSSSETRFIAIGRGDGLRLMFVAFTLRRCSSGVLIRPISARYMHRKEIAQYEKENSGS